MNRLYECHAVCASSCCIPCKSAPEADTSNALSIWEGQELSKSDRPELSSARIVISGGEGSFQSSRSRLWGSVACAQSGVPTCLKSVVSYGSHVGAVS